MNNINVFFESERIIEVKARESQTPAIELSINQSKAMRENNNHFLYLVNNALSIPDIPNVIWHTVEGFTPLSLMWHSTLVIGMRSMALLQSALMGTPTASYQPNLIHKERCTAARLNLID